MLAIGMLAIGMLAIGMLTIAPMPCHFPVRLRGVGAAWRGPLATARTGPIR